MRHKSKSLSKDKMQKILSWFEDTPSPNEGRIKELKDAIKKGRYPTRKMVTQAAAEIISRFEGKTDAL